MAALNLNKVILGGHLTHDPELKQTPSGVATTSFNIAVNRRFEVNGRREVDFITIVAWRQTAEFICKYFKKGNAICVTGSIQNRSWKDKDGNNRHATEIIADEAYFVDGKNTEETTKGAQRANYGLSEPTAKATPNFEPVNKDEDLPF